MQRRLIGLLLAAVILFGCICTTAPSVSAASGMQASEDCITIIKKLDTKDCAVKCISLIADENHLHERLIVDVKRSIRTVDVIERSMERIPLYHALKTIKIDTGNKTVQEIADEIRCI